jgi:cytoskeletal protein CcmA (bactofilin family)
VRIECFDCDKSHNAPQAASSTVCPFCSCYISLTDIIVNDQQTREIRTRGNVIIKKGVTLIGGVSCNNLNALGKVLGKIDCSGQLTYGSSGRALGSVSAQKIIIQKRCEIEFAHEAEAAEFEIDGTATGDFTCTKRFHIGKKGAIYGNVATRSIFVDSGGTLSGQLRIINDPKPAEIIPAATRPPVHSRIEAAVSA